MKLMMNLTAFVVALPMMALAQTSSIGSMKPDALKGISVNLKKKIEPNSKLVGRDVETLQKSKLMKLLGTNSGGGGDEVALKFQQALMSAAEEVKSLPELAQILKKNNILDNAAKASVVIVDETLDVKVRNLVQSSVAANFPDEQTILINRQRWNEIQDERIENAIALHEALSLKKLERTGYYPYSTKYLKFVGGSEKLFQAATGGGDAFVTLKKFFEEAREPVTAAGVAKEMLKLGDKLKCKITSGGKMNPIKFVAVNVYLNEQENGPLFPKEQGWRFVTASSNGSVPDPDSYTWGMISLTEKGYEFIEESHDITETAWPAFTLTVRKNNGHITFLLMSSMHRYGEKFASYGYCFTQAPKSN